MNCAKVRKQILLEGKGDPKVDEHLRSCAGCAIFADSLEQFSRAKPDEDSVVVPPRLDELIKSESRAFLTERARGAAAPSFKRTNFASYFAMAATIALVSWLFISVLTPKRVHEGAGAVTGARNASAASGASLAWDDKVVEDDFFAIDTDIEITFALISVSVDDESGNNSKNSEDEVDDARFKVNIPDILT